MHDHRPQSRDDTAMQNPTRRCLQKRGLGGPEGCSTATGSRARRAGGASARAGSRTCAPAPSPAVARQDARRRSGCSAAQLRTPGRAGDRLSGACVLMIASGTPSSTEEVPCSVDGSVLSRTTRTRVDRSPSTWQPRRSTSAVKGTRTRRCRGALLVSPGPPGGMQQDGGWMGRRRWSNTCHGRVGLRLGRHTSSSCGLKKSVSGSFGFGAAPFIGLVFQCGSGCFLPKHRGQQLAIPAGSTCATTSDSPPLARTRSYQSSPPTANHSGNDLNLHSPRAAAHRELEHERALRASGVHAPLKPADSHESAGTGSVAARGGYDARSNLN
jgi:hypothetical protein